MLDEPTTGLDATVEAEVLDLVRALRHETDAAILLIAHNLGVIRSMCDRVGVMYAGKLVEEGDAVEVFEEPKHPYTIGLLQCLPRHGVRKTSGRCSRSRARCRRSAPPADVRVRRPLRARRRDVPHRRAAAGRSVGDGHFTPLPPRRPARRDPRTADRDPVDMLGGRIVIKLRDVSKTFHQRGHDVPALVGDRPRAGRRRDARARRRVGLGQDDAGQDDARHLRADAGSEISLDDQPLAGKASTATTDDMRAMQMVFQNPDSALNRTWSVRRHPASARSTS